MVENIKSSLEEIIDEVRQDYSHYLSIAQSILNGDHVDEGNRLLVKHRSENSLWFYKHCISPCDFIGIEPDEEMIELLKQYHYKEMDKNNVYEYNDELDVMGDDDDSLDDCNKEMIEFGIRDGCADEDEFKLAKDLWDGKYDVVSSATRGGRYGYDGAMEIILEAKMNSLADFNKFIEIAEHVIGKYDGDITDIKYVRWKLADAYYILERYDRALDIYQDILSKEKHYATRPPLACQIINIKLKAGYKIEAHDIMALAKPSDYNITFSVFYTTLPKADEYLSLKLDMMLSNGMGLLDIINEAHDKEYPFSCFYQLHTVQNMLAKCGRDVRIPYIDPFVEPLKKINDALFLELKFLRIQLNDVYTIQSDWIEDIRLYQKLKNVFPHEDIIHHYRSEWLWKFQFAIFFPRLNLAFDYRGELIQNEMNFTPKSNGMKEYMRIYDKTMNTAETKYGIYVVRVNLSTSFYDLIKVVESYGLKAEY